MWPWEHVFFAYVFYSAYCHLVHRRSPSGPATLALVFGSLLPDLVDKPLAWQFGLFASGYSVAHSIFIAGPVVVLTTWWSAGRDRLEEGAAFGIGYLLHLLGDLLPISIEQGELYYSHLLWPVVIDTSSRHHHGLLDGFSAHFWPYITDLLALELTAVHVLQLGSLLAGLCLWAYDGFPGVGTTIDLARRVPIRVAR